MTTKTKEIRAPRGTELSCKGWIQEAAMRMLMNNLDPDNAEKPEELIVYGGSGGKARRNFQNPYRRTPRNNFQFHACTRLGKLG